MNTQTSAPGRAPVEPASSRVERRTPACSSSCSPSRCVPTALLAALVAASLIGCCTDPVTGDSYFCLYELSDQEEGELGRSFAPNFVAESGGDYPDPELHAYLSEIVVDRMARGSQRPDLPWRFRILNTSQINAFALPGGQVFVTRGLLARLDSEAQFAHLMGHEIGHVTHKHSSRGQGRALLYQLLLGGAMIYDSEVSESDFPIATAVLGLGGQLTLLKYSRDQELESDARGVDYALAAGYDPREGRKTFEMFLAVKQSAGRGESWIDGLLSTHPLDTTRIERIGDYIDDEHPGLATATLTVSTPRFDALMARVRRAQGAYDLYDRAAETIAAVQSGEAPESSLDEAEALLRDGASRLPDHAPFPLGLATLEIARRSPERALRHLDRAVSLDPDLYGARVLRGKVQLDRGRYEEAGIDLESAAALYPFGPQPPFYLAQLAEAQGDPAEAIRRYEQVLERAPEGTDLHTRASERISALRVPAAA